MMRQGGGRENTLWVEKYRPNCVDELVHQVSTKRMLQNVVKTRNMPHCLFYGPPGTGKTSAALALCKELFRDEVWSRRVLELNASDDRGIAVVRNKVKSWAKTIVGQPLNSSCPSFKVVILDEADAMTGDAQSALRRIMEDNAKSTRFIIVCNYVTKIIDPIASRCAKYRFELIPKASQMIRLDQIAQAERISLTKEAIEELLTISEGDLRAAVLLLQSASSLYVDGDQNPLMPEDLRKVAGVPPSAIAKDLFLKASSCSSDQLAAICEDVLAEGWDINQIMRQLVLETIASDKHTEMEKARITWVVAKCQDRLTQGSLESVQLLEVLFAINEESKCVK